MLLNPYNSTSVKDNIAEYANDVFDAFEAARNHLITLAGGVPGKFAQLTAAEAQDAFTTAVMAEAAYKALDLGENLRESTSFDLFSEAEALKWLKEHVMPSVKRLHQAHIHREIQNLQPEQATAISQVHDVLTHIIHLGDVMEG